MTKKTKLELTWPGKEDRPKLEPRILIENPDKSTHATARRSDADIFDNMLIKGDNLLALKALEADYAGKVKCVFIDPPYNTGSAFTHYDDGIEHSLWLSLIRERLEILIRLLSPEGSIWMTIDDAEGHYLKVLCDEIFGRQNFAGDVTWQKTTSIHNNATLFSSSTDHILVYCKSVEDFVMGMIPRTDRNKSDYKNQDQDPRGAWTSSPLHVSLTSGQRGKQYAATGTSSGLFPIISPHGDEIYPPKGRAWAYSEDTIKRLDGENLIWWGKEGRNQPRIKRYIEESKEGVVPSTLWPSVEVGHNQEAKAENAALLASEDELFSTPKPERLLERVLRLATNPGDLVLDSFAGSGTTGAVAHKMGRRWIMVEIGDHADTHIVPRLQKVIDGSDQGGISKATDWKGGGGFRYFTLAPSLLTQDKYGNWVIAKDYNPAMLAEAMCKHMGFTYAPSAEDYWRHGASTETDFIYVTTQSLTHEACAKISQDVGPDRSLLICCKAYSAEAEAFENLTLVKIPTAILQKCEWGRDDYSLNIANLPLMENDGAPTADALPLFGGEAGDE
jgi:adenine-specific DNA-methyltransferase